MFVKGLSHKAGQKDFVAFCLYRESHNGLFLFFRFPTYYFSPGTLANHAGGRGGILTLNEKRKKMSLCYVAQNYWLDNSIKNPPHMKNFQKGSTQYFVRKERLGNFISPLQVILLSYFRLLLLKFEIENHGNNSKLRSHCSSASISIQSL
jgi:hypothetical protein